jgi:hypothetical protein
MSAYRHQGSEGLILDLAQELQPVRRLRSPWLRALGWLAVVAILAGGLSAVADLAAFAARLQAMDMRVAVMGSGLTAILAAIAAFQVSLPDRSWLWALLPVPAAAMWLGASGWGCLQAWVVPDTRIATMDDATHCFMFIVGFSVPLSALLLVMLRRARPLRPGLVAMTGGLASASASASLLWFVHPYDFAATDVLVHLVAVLLVITANGLGGGRLLGTPPSR